MGKIYVNKFENRITFKTKDGYSLELVTPETMKLLGCTRNKITEDKTGENVSHLEITEVALVHYNMVNNDYQQDSTVLYTIEVWFTDQSSQPLETEDRINLTMAIK